LIASSWKPPKQEVAAREAAAKPGSAPAFVDYDPVLVYGCASLRVRIDSGNIGESPFFLLMHLFLQRSGAELIRSAGNISTATTV
jgi:hypothetical protein